MNVLLYALAILRLSSKTIIVPCTVIVMYCLVYEVKLQRADPKLLRFLNNNILLTNGFY